MFQNILNQLVVPRRIRNCWTFKPMGSLNFVMWENIVLWLLICF